MRDILRAEDNSRAWDMVEGIPEAQNNLDKDPCSVEACAVAIAMVPGWQVGWLACLTVKLPDVLGEAVPTYTGRVAGMAYVGATEGHRKRRLRRLD